MEARKDGSHILRRKVEKGLEYDLHRDGFRLALLPEGGGVWLAVDRARNVEGFLHNFGGLMELEDLPGFLAYTSNVSQLNFVSLASGPDRMKLTSFTPWGIWKEKTGEALFSDPEVWKERNLNWLLKRATEVERRDYGAANGKFSRITVPDAVFAEVLSDMSDNTLSFERFDNLSEEFQTNALAAAKAWKEGQPTPGWSWGGDDNPTGFDSPLFGSGD